jgi:hypothetical protein
MLFALLRTRIKTLLFTVLLAFAAPRVARVLRGIGERQRRSGGNALTTTVPLGAADVLDKLAVWARPQKKRRR